MSVTLKKVENKKDLDRFIWFPEKLYKDCPYYTPKLYFDQVDSLDPKRNPASEFCDSELYLAYKDGEEVGRVAAIINRRANEEWNHKQVRFGWFDFVDDKEVSKALLDKVTEFGKERGMDEIVGPLGFTDFDPEGMLVDGFDCECTMALTYNHAYYYEHMKEFGFEQDAKWNEFRYAVEDKVPEALSRGARIVAQRSNVHYVKMNKWKIIRENFGLKFFHLANECYKDLYNFTLLPDHMAGKYTDFYLKVLNLEYTSFVENEKGELVAFGVTMPSLAKALNKTRGKLFPFGWIEIFKAMYCKNEGSELLLIGVRPDYRHTGINAMVFAQILEAYARRGVRWADSNSILDDNFGSQTQFKYFDEIFHTVRLALKKKI